tara:strand:- start:158 stop:2053 length:1896 start_codon:yes stop_codon:yes gene_type:complete
MELPRKNDEVKLIKMEKYISKNIILLVLISTLIFASKWFFSFYYFKDSIDIKILFDTDGDGYFYYYYTKYISDLNLLDLFTKNNEGKSIAGQAFFSLLPHAILLKFFGFNGFLIGEFICIFLFLLIVYKICRLLNLSNFFSISIPLFFFCVPLIIEISFLNNFTILQNFKQIYNLRYPNPMVSNLFLFLFIFFLLKMEKSYFLNYKNIAVFSIILGITFSAYFYYFIVQIITLTIFILYKENKNFFFQFNKKIKLLLFFLIIFFIISSPFIFILINAEPDYMERVGTLIIDDQQKKILLNHFLIRIFSMKFLLIFAFNIIITLILKIKKSENTNFKIIFDLFLISTLISPLMFIQFSPKISPLYYFNFTIFISLFLSVFFGICFLIKDFLNQINIIAFNKYLKFFLISSLLIVIISHRYIEYKSLNLDQNYKEFRNNFSLVTNEIKKHNNFDNIITLNDRLMIWATLHNFKDVPLLSGVLTSESNKSIENKLFESFKILGLNENDFSNSFRNKRSNWRFLNRFTQIFFWYRYSANALTTYNQSIDFDKSDLEFIKKISPLHVQSIAIPRSELFRLKNDFINYKKRSNIIANYIVIFDKEMIGIIKKEFNEGCYITKNKNLFFLALNNENCL